MQKTEENTAKKSRTPWQKEGKYRYLHRKLDKMREEYKQGIKELKAAIRVLTNSLQPFLEPDAEYIQGIICHDEGDQAILEFLLDKDPEGITPTQVCTSQQFKRFHFKPYHVTRRIQRMNERLRRELGKPVAESYHRRWMVTSFVRDAYGKSKQELEEERDDSLEFP